jgi:hypothetical protein
LEVEPSKVQFYQFGTDHIISLIDGWGPENQDPVKIPGFVKEGSMPLAFLVAGVGDGAQRLAICRF